MTSATLSTYARKDCERIRDIATSLVPEGRYFEHGIRSCIEGLLLYELVMAILFKSAGLDDARSEKITETYTRAFMDICGQKSMGCATVMLAIDDRLVAIKELVDV